MNAAGIVRRIDDLGRVAIPKEIRKITHIKEGDPIEIYTDRDGAIILKKYVPNNTNDVVVYLVYAARALGFDIGVYDDLGAWLGGSLIGSTDYYIDLEAERENLIIVVDTAVSQRAFLYIKVVKESLIATLESIEALAQMASIILNEG